MRRLRFQFRLWMLFLVVFVCGMLAAEYRATSTHYRRVGRLVDMGWGVYRESDVDRARLEDSWNSYGYPASQRSGFSAITKDRLASDGYFRRFSFRRESLVLFVPGGFVGPIEQQLVDNIVPLTKLRTIVIFGMRPIQRPNFVPASFIAEVRRRRPDLNIEFVGFTMEWSQVKPERIRIEGE